MIDKDIMKFIKYLQAYHGGDVMEIKEMIKMKIKLNKKRFENNLNKNNQNFQNINAVKDNEQEKYLNVFEMIDLLNELHEEKEQLKRQINYNAECLTDVELNHVKLEEQYKKLQEELFESERAYIHERYYHKSEIRTEIEELRNEFKKRFGRDFE